MMDVALVSVFAHRHLRYREAERSPTGGPSDIALFGSTGRIGRRIQNEALSRGHHLAIVDELERPRFSRMRFTVGYREFSLSSYYQSSIAASSAHSYTYWLVDGRRLYFADGNEAIGMLTITPFKFNRAGFQSRSLLSAMAASILGTVILTVPTHADDSKIGLRTDANQLASEVVRNELIAQEQDKSLWKYREVREQDGKTELREIVETRDGEVHRVLAINGKPLSGKERQNEERRIQKLLSNPNELREKQRNLAHDADQERNLLKMLPQAFVYTSDGMEDGLIKLEFRPNPQFHATSHESEVFHHMEGELWVDARSHRLAEIDGRLMTEVKFWDGLLGHLDKGGTFRVRQRDVGGGHWEMTDLDVNMNGKALFFKTIGVHEKQTDADFRQLPEHTTLKQAGELLAINTPD